MRPIERIDRMCGLLRQSNINLVKTLQVIFGDYENDAIAAVVKDDELVNFLGRCYEVPLSDDADPISNLRTIWGAYPDLRLGQLVGNFISFADVSTYYEEDAAAEHVLVHYLKSLK